MQPQPQAEPEAPASPPLGPTGEPAEPDHVGLAFRALFAGVAAGVAAVSAAMWLYRSLQVSGVAPLAPTVQDPVANLVLFGWLGGALAGFLLAFLLLRPLGSAYRRGGLAMVAGFGALVVGLVTAPVDSLLGRWGLLGLVAVCAALALWQARHALRTRW